MFFHLFALFWFQTVVDPHSLPFTWQAKCVLFNSYLLTFLLVDRCCSKLYAYLKGFKYGMYNLGWELWTVEKCHLLCKVLKATDSLLIAASGFPFQDSPSVRQLLQLQSSMPCILATQKVKGQRNKVKVYASANFPATFSIFATCECTFFNIKVISLNPVTGHTL